MPSGKFGANAAWLAFNVMAHNMARRTSRIGFGGSLIATDTLRRHHLVMPDRVSTSARKLTMHRPLHWPWADYINDGWTHLRAVQLAT